jgi:hypothetical protein
MKISSSKTPPPRVVNDVSAAAPTTVDVDKTKVDEPAAVFQATHTSAVSKPLVSSSLSAHAAVAWRGCALLLDAAKERAAAGRAWWVVQAPAGALVSMSNKPDAAVHALASAHLHSGDAAGAWRVLAEHGDGFARLMSSTLQEQPSNVFSQVVDAHWQRLTGHGVNGATYKDVAGALAHDYLAHAAQHGSLPSTTDIERMDRNNLEQRGLSPLLAVGAMQSKLASDMGNAYSWGRAMGLPAERVAHRSDVFADVDFDPTAELAKTAHAAVMKYGFDKALTIDGATATLRGLQRGGALHVSHLVLAGAQQLAAQGDVAGAWQELARHGDDYAVSATKIIAQKDRPQDLLACVVDAHWRRVVGEDLKAAKFDEVAARHLRNYLALVDAGDGALPDTHAIERSYRDAVVSAGLPALVAIDALLSRADAALPDSLLGRLGVTAFSWGAMCGMPAARIQYQSNVFADLDIDVSKELAATTLATLRLHPLAFVRASNVRYGWNALREIF